ncbi:MAG TPA: hypothetical protein VJ204_19775, partial [Solirubrobacterales bacterium]|nr:hypothetical protein [Solirubrobacterales bacterium]
MVYLATAPGAPAATNLRDVWVTVAPNGRAVELVFVPSSTTVSEFARAGFSPGLMSAGLGTVEPEQTYLDIGAGNRVFNSLYDHEIGPVPKAVRACPSWFAEAVKRAESAPDEIEPGLMVERLEAAGVAAVGLGASPCPLGIKPFGGAFVGSLREGRRGVLSVTENPLTVAAKLARAAGPNQLVIAISTPTDKSDEPIPMGIAGKGYDGDLTSDTTRTNGYVLSTDIAPTILEFF